jgi:hypothetical chaperone protein
MTRALGLDFGTTNTVMALARPDGSAAPVTFEAHGADVKALRTALCFWRQGLSAQSPVVAEVGPWAIEQFIEHPGECRFMQSMKSFAASASFQGTRVFQRMMTFEELMATFLDKAFAHGAAALGDRPPRVVVGRPVKFVGAAPDAALAMTRYRQALAGFGFEDVHFVHEPVAAALFFAQRLEKSATVLVADFGGGTSDYSLLRFERQGNRLTARSLGQGGVGIAGDTFDYRIIDRVILPRVGKGSHYQSMGKTLELPNSLFANFARWNWLSVLKTSKEFADLKRTLPKCLEQDKIERLIDFVEEDQGYPLYKVISEAKTRLSTEESADIRFDPLGRDFAVTITRAEFETWIADDLARLETALDETLADAALTEGAIDHVFLTGGTSFVPSVKAIFERRFGPARVSTGDQLISIANGLALIGERDDVAEWAVN